MVCVCKSIVFVFVYEKCEIYILSLVVNHKKWLIVRGQGYNYHLPSLIRSINPIRYSYLIVRPRLRLNKTKKGR